MSNLNNLFLDYCKKNSFEINKGQLKIIKDLENFQNKNFNFSISNFFSKRTNKKLGIYLYGDVGVGKTMILNFFFDHLNVKKQRLHFNEFMIKFHDFKFNNPNNQNVIKLFVKEFKKNFELIYFDEFQVTNIVDAMILGQLFQEIFSQNIFVFFSSNIKIENLYKEGLQRDQFIPFLNVIKKRCIELDLSIDNDYRLKKVSQKDFFTTKFND